MQQRNDIYNKESNQLPRRRKSSPSSSSPTKGLYGNRERHRTIGEDLRGRESSSSSSRSNRAATPHRRRRSSRAAGANKWLLILLLAVLLTYLVVLAVSLYRGYLRSQEEPAPAPVVETEAEEAVPAEAVVHEDAATVAARDAGRAREHIEAWQFGVNALSRAELDLQRGDSERAIRLLEEAIDRAPNMVDLKLELADLYMARKRFAEARDLYENALQADPLREGVRLKWAQSLHALNHHQAALQAALWILDDDSFLEEPNQIAAMSYMGMEQIAGALPHLRRQVAVNRENVVAQNNLAVAYSRLGDYGRAVTLFRDVLEADPGNAVTYYNLAVCYSQQGDVEQAVATLELAAKRFGLSFVSAWFKSRDFDPIRDAAAFRQLESLDELPEEAEQESPVQSASPSEG